MPAELRLDVRFNHTATPESIGALRPLMLLSEQPSPSVDHHRLKESTCRTFMIVCPCARYCWGPSKKKMKLGVRALVEREAKSFGERGARLVFLSPGTIDTPMTRREALRRRGSRRVAASSAAGHTARSEGSAERMINNSAGDAWGARKNRPPLRCSFAHLRASSPPATSSSMAGIRRH